MKLLIIFLLFNIIIFLDMFRKLKENMSNSCQTSNRPMNLSAITSLTECKKQRGECLSANCNNKINGCFNKHLLEDDNPLDEYGQNVSAYCCIKCRDSGGCEHDNSCDEKPDQKNNSSLCNNYKESFTSIREGSSTSNETEYTSNVLGLVTNDGYICKGGIIDPGSCDCYSPIGEISYDYASPRNGQMSENCGPYRFYQCYSDPSCIASLNSIRMNSFKDFEPVENETWGINTANILLNPNFHGAVRNSEYITDDNFKDLFSPYVKVNENAKSGYKSLLSKKNGEGWCKRLCKKATNPNNEPDENGIHPWDDSPELLTIEGKPTPCALSDAKWAAKFLCNGCHQYEKDYTEWSLSDHNYMPIKCKDGRYSNYITDKINWKTVDKHGHNVSNRFNNSKDINGNFTDYRTLLSGELPSTKWSKDRDYDDLQLACRLHCGYEMHDKCYEQNPLSNSETQKIRDKCIAVCRKQMPCPGFMSKIASLQNKGSDPPSEAPEFDSSEKEISSSDKHSPIALRSKSWKKIRDVIFSLGSHSA